VGSHLAFVAGEDQAVDSAHQGMSKMEAWQLASCIAALPQILLQKTKTERQEVSTGTWAGSSLGALYDNLIIH
jgi:hypothetical protein